MARDRSDRDDNELSAERRSHQHKTDHDEFVMHVIGAQSRLYAYILSLILDKERAADILQQTNLVLLEKEDEFERDTNFFAWAARVAYYEVLADRRRRQRDRHLFSDELLALVASESEKAASTHQERADALRECMKKLTAKQRDLLNRRYRPGGGVAALAEALGKTPNAVSAMLFRIRSSLTDCVHRTLSSLHRS